MKVSDLVNVLSHLPGDWEIVGDVKIKYNDDAEIAASSVLENIRTGKPASTPAPPILPQEEGYTEA